MKKTMLMQRFESVSLRCVVVAFVLCLCVAHLYYLSEHLKECTQKPVTSGSVPLFPSLAGDRGRSKSSRSSAVVGILKGQWLVQELWECYDCQKILFDSGDLPIPRPSDWAYIRAAYYGVMGSSVGNDVMHNGNLAEIAGLTGVEAIQSPGRGRGLFATVAYKKGDRIKSLSDEIYTGYFNTSQQYREFLLALPRNLACEVTRWSYTMEYLGKPLILLDLGFQSLVNNSPSPNAEGAESGVALKDILPGDEILVDYTKYEAYAWNYMGLGKWEGQMMGMVRGSPESSDESNDSEDLSEEEILGDGWLMGDLWELRGCRNVIYESGDIPIPSLSDWMFLRGAYAASSGLSELYSLFPDGDISAPAFIVDVEVKQTPRSGRGVFAKQDIAAGTVIIRTGPYAEFYNPFRYRSFLINLPSAFSCSVMIWAYTSRDEEGKVYVGLDLGKTSLLNNSDESNVKEIDGVSVTVRDVEEGEELLISYRGFEKEGLWESLGFGNWEQIIY
ncbi:hypothetical protein TrLO_g5916 [Triparma laevis f. longispina]|uniref:SET domain-containing protein n=1 Tax=Triparma laevis f. longispina TaxID=1714387 RepID=A0A9W7F0Y3_9STRA|nr:hypothetical protein TrLO_g5916 [Triparma laevis f. longispina]